MANRDRRFAARIVPVLGDLGQPRLGLSEANWTALSTQIDAIVHNGAYVHWLLPYAKLRPSNVEATVEVLRFACTGRVKLVHYVSTTSVRFLSSLLDFVTFSISFHVFASGHALDYV